MRTVGRMIGAKLPFGNKSLIAINKLIRGSECFVDPLQWRVSTSFPSCVACINLVQCSQTVTHDFIRWPPAGWLTSSFLLILLLALTTKKATHRHWSERSVQRRRLALWINHETSLTSRTISTILLGLSCIRSPVGTLLIALIELLSPKESAAVQSSTAIKSR